MSQGNPLGIDQILIILAQMETRLGKLEAEIRDLKAELQKSADSSQ